MSSPHVVREHRRPGRRAYLLVTLFAFLMVLVPFLFWYQTWFGRPLTDRQISEYLSNRSEPRLVQQALAQMSERLAHYRDVSRWYPDILRQASSPNRELRLNTAWVMGEVRGYAPFQEALHRLLHDLDPMIRRNAANSLAALRDPAAEPELLAMLRPYPVTAPVSGHLKFRLKLGDYVNPGTLIAHVGETEVRAPVPGEVRSFERPDGSEVKAGDSLLELGADKGHIWEALRGLNLVGQPPDLEVVERYTYPIPGLPDTIRQQAILTRQEIQARASSH